MSKIVHYETCKARMPGKHINCGMACGGHPAGVIETQNNADLSIEKPERIRYVGVRARCKAVLEMKTGKEHPEVGGIDFISNITKQITEG